MIRAILLLAAVVSTNFGAEKGAQADEDNVREALFNHLILDTGGSHRGFKVYFLSVNTLWTNSSSRISRTDPSDEFMRRFAGRTPPVLKVSACEDRQTNVVDKITGRRGIIFTVSNLKWISSTEVEAFGSVYEAGLAGCWATYTLTNSSGRWKVTGTKDTGIS